jgi:polyhydroxyalkanoate synthase
MDKRISKRAAAERQASAWLGEHRPKEAPPSSPADLDRLMTSWLGKFTADLSPVALGIAYLDWLAHLQLSPSKKQELLLDGINKFVRLTQYSVAQAGFSGANAEPCVVPLPQDRRFSDPAWQTWPYNVLSQAFLLNQQWWHRATTGVAGVSTHHADVVTFLARQWLDMLSPSNFPLTNPVVRNETAGSGGRNLILGAVNAWRDWENKVHGEDTAKQEYKVGVNLAVTPGKVVFRNRLIELIQYAPSTAKVHSQPLLIVPAWIMKYYILDLSQQNSLVKYLVDQGHTVFMVSWKNPDAGDRDLSMEDYRQLGVMAAIDAVQDVTGAEQINAVGYCLGGTLLAIAAAAMARDGDRRLGSMTLFAAQVDFKEPGELSLFIDESQIAFLEAAMWDHGYLDTRHMAGAFQMLRSNDLIWSRNLNQYLLGKSEQKNDLMSWNADATRMPYRMHSEYLRNLFLENNLAQGRYRVEGRPVALSDIRCPIFTVATLTDHVAPWRSVYKIHLLTDTEVTFVLTSGGHNAGVVSPPGHPRRSYQMSVRAHRDAFVDPDDWEDNTPIEEGSWWPAWESWLAARSGERVKPPAMPKGLCDAPGTYILQS